jgi:hypothetical protein
MSKFWIIPFANQHDLVLYYLFLFTSENVLFCVSFCGLNLLPYYFLLAVFFYQINKTLLPSLLPGLVLSLLILASVGLMQLCHHITCKHIKLAVQIVFIFKSFTNFIHPKAA